MKKTAKEKVALFWERDKGKPDKW